jgi:glutamate-5-semialdehyde dehydrogenase
MSTLIEQARLAKEASFALSAAGTNQKNRALFNIADKLVENTAVILSENKKDIDAAVENGIKPAMIDRLRLSEARIKAIAGGVREVAALNDPIGEVLSMNERPNGLIIGKKRVPLGLIGVIFESRPNVSVDVVSLTLKTGNACLLRGGKEALNSNKILCEIMRNALKEAGLPKPSVELLTDTSRETAKEMMRLNGVVDVLIPRGGAGLIKTVVENATIPVIETGTGNCHIYVDDTAGINMALDILVNAKTQRPSVCNACESLLVSEKIADGFLPLAKKSLEEKGVELRGCEKTAKIIDVEPASEEDFYTEYNDLIISVKVVEGINQAIAHINKYSTKHSESIITRDYANSQLFLKLVDSAAVYINASTRFTDGFEFGFGAEIGISTQKLHARGPMGLNELTTIKYIIYGNGQIRQ